MDCDDRLDSVAFPSVLNRCRSKICAFGLFNVITGKDYYTAGGTW